MWQAVKCLFKWHNWRSVGERRVDGALVVVRRCQNCSRVQAKHPTSKTWRTICL